MSDSDLKEKEEAGVLNDTAADFSPEEQEAFGALSDNDAPDDRAGGLYRGDPKPAKKRFWTKKRATGGGIAGLLIAATLGTLTITSGPLQFIHIAQLLQKFHFSNQEDVADGRMLKISRYIRNNGSERTRLNLLGNKYADLVEGKLNRSGIVSEYDRLGFQESYRFDPTKLADKSELANLKNKSPTELQEHLKASTGIDFKIGADGVLRANFEGLNYRDSKKLMRVMLEDAGYSKMGAAIRSRIMGKRAGVDWHPMKKLDKTLLKTVDARIARWREERESRIKNGETSIDPSLHEDEASRPVDKDGNPIPNSEAAEAAQAGNEATPPHVPDETPSSRLTAVSESPGFRKSAGATAIVGVICAVKAISGNIDQVKYANVVMPLMRLGMESVAVGNQVMSGRDVDMEQLGFYAKQLSDPKTGSWAAAKSIQAELGQDQTGPDIKSEAKIKSEENAVSQFLGSIPGIDPLCDAAGSIFGQVVSTAIDLVGGPISAIVGAGFSTYVAPSIIEGVIHWLAGEQIDLTVAGADFGNYINYGARLASNDSAIAGGGRALSTTESAVLKEDRLKSEQETVQHASFYDRIFNPLNTFSLASRIIDKQTPSPTSYISSIVRAPLNLTKIISSTVTSFMPHAHAQTSSYDYGFPEFGYSTEELDNTLVKNPFENALSAANTLDIPCEINGKPNNPCGQDYINDIKACFGVDVSKPEGIWIVTSPGGATTRYSDIENYKNPHTGIGCGSKDSRWLQLRFFVFDSQLMDSNACYEGEATSCQEMAL